VNSLRLFQHANSFCLLLKLTSKCFLQASGKIFRRFFARIDKQLLKNFAKLGVNVGSFGERVRGSSCSGELFGLKVLGALFTFFFLVVSGFAYVGRAMWTIVGPVVHLEMYN